jgi:hypothetical protein
MSKRIQISIGCITGEGKTTASARIDALERAEVALSGRYDPIFVTYRGVEHLAVRTPTGWASWSLVRRQVTVCWPSSMTREQVERAVRLEVAQLAWDGREDGSAVLTDARDAKEFGGWVAFQRAFRRHRAELIAKGHGEREADTLAHNLAQNLGAVSAA